jgi:hypothetical protein
MSREAIEQKNYGDAATEIARVANAPGRETRLIDEATSLRPSRPRN